MDAVFEPAPLQRLREQVAKQFWKRRISVPEILGDRVEFDAFVRRVRGAEPWLWDVAEGDVQDCLEEIFRDESPESARIVEHVSPPSGCDRPAVASRNISESVSVNGK